MPPGEQESALRIARFVTYWVLAWVAALLALALIELQVDPGLEGRTGAILDAVSIVVAALGLLLVPIGAIARSRAGQRDWMFSVIAGAIALVAFVVGVAIDVVIYLALERL